MSVSVVGDTGAELVDKYRSPGLPRGYFGRVGSLHMHVDGGGEPALVRELLQRLEREGGKGKLDLITDSIAGPQRADFPETYRSHTPGLNELERFEYFSTIHLRDRLHAIGTLRQTLPFTTRTPGVIVEVEHVVGRAEGKERWSGIDIDRVPPITSCEAGFERVNTLPFELHVAIEIFQQTRPLTLGELLEKSIAAGVRVGSWFEFRKNQVWAYRSNAFAYEQDFVASAIHSHESIERWLSGSGFDYRLWTIAERVLGVWRSIS